jgi:hypothetical protein
VSSDQQLTNVNPQNIAVTPSSQNSIPSQADTTQILGPAPTSTNPADATLPPTPPAGPPPGRYSALADIVRGVFRGASAIDEMHAPGVLAWIAVGFIPVAGTLAAIRDARYALLIRDWGALFFNVLGLIPFAKGFSNVALASRAHQVHRAVHTAHQVAHVVRRGRALGAKGRQVAQASVATGAAHGVGVLNLMASEGATLDRNVFAWPALLFALITALVAPLAAILALVASAVTSFFPTLSQGYATLIVAAMALLWSLSAVMLARRANRDAKLLMGRQYARAIISWLASVLSWLSFTVVLVASLGLLFAERGLFGVR